MASTAFSKTEASYVWRGGCGDPACRSRPARRQGFWPRTPPSKDLLGVSGSDHHPIRLQVAALALSQASSTRPPKRWITPSFSVAKDCWPDFRAPASGERRLGLEPVVASIGHPNPHPKTISGCSHSAFPRGSMTGCISPANGSQLLGEGDRCARVGAPQPNGRPTFPICMFGASLGYLGTPS